MKETLIKIDFYQRKTNENEGINSEKSKKQEMLN